MKETRNLDIISHGSCIKPNELFKGLACKARSEGHATTESFSSIPDEDMNRLGVYFDQDLDEGKAVDPKKLQNAVLFCIMYFLCHWGRENLHNMQKDTFAIYTDASGAEYLAQKWDELDKNHQADSTSIANTGKIYTRPGKNCYCAGNDMQKTPGFFDSSIHFCAKYSEDEVCPVWLYKHWTQKLNTCGKRQRRNHASSVMKIPGMKHLLSARTHWGHSWSASQSLQSCQKSTPTIVWEALASRILMTQTLKAGISSVFQATDQNQLSKLMPKKCLMQKRGKWVTLSMKKLPQRTPKTT